MQAVEFYAILRTSMAFILIKKEKDKEIPLESKGKRAKFYSLAEVKKVQKMFGNDVYVAYELVGAIDKRYKILKKISDL